MSCRERRQRVADYGDGWLPRARNTSEYNDPDKLPEARRHIEELYRANGRDPSALNITMWDAPPDREQNRRFFDAGADHVVHMLTTRGERETVEALERVAGGGALEIWPESGGSRASGYTWSQQA